MIENLKFYDIIYDNFCYWNIFCIHNIELIILK